MRENIYFEITDGPDIIKIEPLEWCHPNAEMDWDKNWVYSKITVKGGAFRGQFTCNLITTDFELFKRELGKLYDNLKGQASFKTLEEQIYIKIDGDGIGHFNTECELMDDAGIGNKLVVKMTFDQTQIPIFVQQLNNIIKEFPIQGTELQIRNE